MDAAIRNEERQGEQTMNLEQRREYIFTKKHHQFRRTVPEIAEEYSALQLGDKERMVRRFELLADTEAERPLILEDEPIVFTRTVSNIPEIYTVEEWEEIRKNHFVHERGYLSNLSPDYETVLKDGLLVLKKKADSFLSREIDAILRLSDAYRDEARRIGRKDVAEVLERVPRYGASSFREALQLFRIIHYCLWLEGNYHVTCGRFDQYMSPYLQHDLEKKALSVEEALELVKEFFLTFNKDSDTYVGVQQGDNGQSMVLGGMIHGGEEGFNLLSEMCLKASYTNMMIDPKINLRVSARTPMEVFEKGSELTKAGLGFPQYSNDDVVIPGLVRLGYAPEDAANYAVAACWEFIIPKYGFDIANIGALSFPKAVDRALHGGKRFDRYQDLEKEVCLKIREIADEIIAQIHDLYFAPSPLLESLLQPKYYNFGIHGTGLSDAADSLAALNKYVFDENRYTLDQVIDAMDRDFDDAPEMLRLLRYEAPKMGSNDDLPDGISVRLLDSFSEALSGRKNCLGGFYRAGTGSAMFYLRHASEIGASPDGRRKGEPFGANFSPSLFSRTKGPYSVISSFTKQHFQNAINGGPLTMEFSHSVFSAEDGVAKTAALVRSFILKGGHQLQLNSVNPEIMKDAQVHPENHASLIVRVWGWSAYFIELDKEYQDQVIARQEDAV